MEYVKEPSDGNYVLHIRDFKLRPHLYFPEYETSVWIDASLLLKRDIRTLIEQYERGSGLLCFPHQRRRCIYEEGAEVIRLRKAPKRTIILQMAHYLNAGYGYPIWTMY